MERLLQLKIDAAYEWTPARLRRWYFYFSKVGIHIGRINKYHSRDAKMWYISKICIYQASNTTWIQYVYILIVSSLLVLLWQNTWDWVIDKEWKFVSHQFERYKVGDHITSRHGVWWKPSLTSRWYRVAISCKWWMLCPYMVGKQKGKKSIKIVPTSPLARHLTILNSKILMT